MLKESLRCLENPGMPSNEMALTLWYLAILYHYMNEAKFRIVPRETIHELVQKAQELFEKLGIYYDKTLRRKILED